MVPRAYLEYLFQFHRRRDYYECHEILENHWKSEGRKNGIWVGLIQVAAALHHYRRGNGKGAGKLIEKSLFRLSGEEEALKRLGFDSGKFLSLLEQTRENVRKGRPYQDVDLPLTDPGVRREYEEYARKREREEGEREPAGGVRKTGEGEAPRK
jgi:predicted metal-dependent hydrolase